MISGVLVGDRQLVQRLTAMPRAIQDEVVPTMQKLGFELETRVKRDKLTGQVLKVRTGRLRSSISPGAPDTRSHMEIDGTSVRYFVGTNVKYGRFWELGFHGTESVRAFTRQQTMAFGRPIAARAVSVRAHSRRVDVAARPFLAPTLEEIRSLVVEQLSAALVRAVQKAA